MKIERRLGRDWSRWDGSVKYKTKNCEECDFYRKIDNKELCGWGVAFKYLVKRDKSKRCEFKDRKNEGYIPSITYLDEIINQTGRN